MRCSSSNTASSPQADWLEAIAWNEHGLVPAIVQDHSSGRVLMFAWMNRQALAATVASGYATYWSRSRAKLWVKGETSGHRQRVHTLRLDCDNDAVLVSVEQIGGIACHTGRERCFYQCLDGGVWQADEPVQQSPEDIYG